MCPISEGDIYIVVLMDDHPSYCLFFSCLDTAAEEAARVSID